MLYVIISQNILTELNSYTSPRNWLTNLALFIPWATTGQGWFKYQITVNSIYIKARCIVLNYIWQRFFFFNLKQFYLIFLLHFLRQLVNGAQIYATCAYILNAWMPLHQKITTKYFFFSKKKAQYCHIYTLWEITKKGCHRKIKKNHGNCEPCLHGFRCVASKQEIFSLVASGVLKWTLDTPPLNLHSDTTWVAHFGSVLRIRIRSSPQFFSYWIRVFKIWQIQREKNGPGWNNNKIS